MEIEQLEVLNFISRHPPFSDLPEVELRKIAKNIEVAYYKKDTDILKYGSPIHDLYMIRSGVVEVYRRNGELYNRIDEGRLFGQMGILMNNRVRMPAKAIEDSLIYCIPESILMSCVSGLNSLLTLWNWRMAQDYKGSLQVIRRVMTSQQ